MIANDFNPGLRRRKIEDMITHQYDQINFTAPDCRWLDEQKFWDYVFSWYDLVKYYDETTDTAIGAHMLELYRVCVTCFHAASTNRQLPEHRRDKAANALYQINYYVNEILLNVHRNTRTD